MILSDEEFRKALGRFATGVTVIGVAGDEGQVHGMTANAFTSASLNPLPTPGCVDGRIRTHPLIHERKRFGVNVLAGNYARASENHDTPRDLGAAFEFTEGGTPLLKDRLANLECSLVSPTTRATTVSLPAASDRP